MNRRSLSCALGALALFTAGASQAAPNPYAPHVLYTDLASGPNSGGENGLGTYLSIFGRNFGSAGLGSRVKVTIGGVEVAQYVSLGPGKGRNDVQRITVRIGALTGQPSGVPLPVVVSVAGVGSNADQTFTINPGRFLYVDNVRGNDATAVPGDITHPYRHVQLPDTTQAAFGAAQPGDVIVMRGSGTAWTDLGNDTYFVKFIHKDGTAPSGSAGSGPLTLMGYPGEDVYIDVQGPSTQKGALSGIDTTSGIAGGHWVTIADLRIESGGNSGVIATQIAGDHWRIVNNELSAATATDTARAGGINGNASNAYWYGNHIHDIAGGASQENHGIYIDGDGNYDIGYNHIERVTGGSGLQVYVNGGNGSNWADHVHFHHNLVHDISKHGLNLADNARNDIALWDNVVHHVAFGCLRLNSAILSGARVYNNTFDQCDRLGTSQFQGALMNDAVMPAGAISIVDNIVVPAAGQWYTGGSVGVDSSTGTIDHNLWFDGAGSVAFDTHALGGDPHWMAPAQGDYHAAPTSPAIDAGVDTTALAPDDFDATVVRPAGSAVDIGAFEYLAGYAYDRIFADAFE